MTNRSPVWRTTPEAQLHEGSPLLPIMSEDVDDVRRALTIVFRGMDGLARADLERAFSFDME